MTAVNIFRQRERISILTDAAGYDARTGVMVHQVSKCVPIAHLKSALAMRGSSVATSLFAANFGGVFETFDDLVERGGAFAEDLYDNRFAALTASGETELDMSLAGWSDSRRRMEVYALESHDRNGREPWKFHLQEAPVFGAPVPSDDVLAAHGVVAPSDPEYIDPVALGIRIMEAQRSLTFCTTVDGEGDEFHLVGGHVLLTTIRRDEVSQRVIHRWPEDVCGEVIRPRPKVVDEPTLHLGNRQQRRAWERENRGKRRLDA